MPDEEAKAGDPAEITLEVYRLLSALDPSDRRKVLTAVATLLGETVAAATSGAAIAPGRMPSPTKELILGSDFPSDAAGFLAAKDPRTKVEELAVAARYRELRGNEDVHEKDQIRDVIRLARRNFDDRNFHRDISNAKIAGLFNKGRDLTLSFYGQNYVDALPDRDAVKALRRPKGARRRTGGRTGGTKKGKSAK